MQKEFRLVAVVLEGALARNEVPPKQKSEYEKLLENIVGTCGHTPKLNDATIRLPAKQFRPEGMRNGQTIRKWKTIPWSNPQRRIGVSTQVVSFFTGATPVLGDPVTAAVRQDLIAQANMSASNEKMFSYIDRDFFSGGNLHADHLQASADILERQKEMIEAMNLDEAFREEMLSHPQSEGCFLVDATTNEIVGTKYFYMLYHNCIDNLWLMSPAANSGAGKSAQDAIEWLKAQKFGQEFLAEVGPINKQGVLYETKDGELLASAAAKFVRKKYAEALEVVKLAEEVKGDLSERAFELVDNPGLMSPVRKRGALMAEAAMAKISSGMRSNLSLLDFGGVVPDDVAMTDANFALMESLVPKTPLEQQAERVVSKFKFKKHETTPNAKDVVVTAGELLLSTVKHFIADSAHSKIPPHLRVSYAQRAITDLQSVLAPSINTKKRHQQQTSPPAKRLKAVGQLPPVTPPPSTKLNIQGPTRKK